MTAPAMLMLWIAGIVMVVAYGQMPHLWLIVKIVVVVLLSGLHGFFSCHAVDCPVYGADYAADDGTPVLIN